MNKLIEGVQRFRRDVFEPRREFFVNLANGQQPIALFITCADSRIDPCLITQTEPGDIFVLRNAGNFVPPILCGEAASVEYAVAELRVRHIVVCGHSHCGAVKALLAPDAVSGLSAVSAWLQHGEATRRVVENKYPHLEGAERLRAAVEENVLVQLGHLRTYPTVAAALAKNELTLHGWVYRIETGEISAFDQSQGRFVPLNADATAALSAI
jgi:carbonic anhydrase